MVGDVVDVMKKSNEDSGSLRFYNEPPTCQEMGTQDLRKSRFYLGLE